MPSKTITGPSRGAETTTPRARAFAGIPAAERRLDLAGISTALLDGGDGPPIVALHGPGANASHWARVIPALTTSNRVVAPDLPGQGASTVDGDLTRDRVIDWLDELIEQTCPAPPALVGNALGGGIAARYAIERPNRCGQLVLVDALGLRSFQPSPRFGHALNEYVADPTEATHDGLWGRCAHDLPSLRSRMGRAWDAMAAYDLDRAQTPSVQKALGVLMGEFALPAIPSEELAGIQVPTTLIWGRHDEATPLDAARQVAERNGWPLEVIEDCADDPPVEQPEAFVRALRTVLGEEDAR